ncbi:RND superfamily drug exporter [Janibacter hoylei PVAS-1]|uniref:RND superfamily drug exporter n=1 Tax=Janibacter hoylei PVAS-1 TaxID=1210046 RepID=K1E0S0_9MICO|nr:RND superfamily drug exporter [Janibacter hoylei PVAS-1]
MAHALYRLGRTAFRRWPVFLIGWLVVLIGIGAVAGTLSKPLSDKFTIPGIESEQAQTLQQELFPGAKDAFDQATGTVVVQAPAGEKLSDPANAAAVEDLLTDLRAAPPGRRPGAVRRPRRRGEGGRAAVPRPGQGERPAHRGGAGQRRRGLPAHRGWPHRPDPVDLRRRDRHRRRADQP